MEGYRIPHKRCGDDGGAVIIEAALVLPILLLFLAGVIDFGAGFRDRTEIQGAVRAGARVGASSVGNVTADQLALSTMYAGLQGMPRITIQKAIIYEANGFTNGQPSATCTSIGALAGGAGDAGANCSVYGLSQIQAAAASPTTFNFGTLSGVAPNQVSACSTGWNRYWCAGGGAPPYTATGSNERTADLSLVVDSFGLWLQVSYQPFTRVFTTSDIIMTDYTVMRLEPTPG